MSLGGIALIGKQHGDKLRGATRVRDVGFVQLGPDIRRGAVDYNGLGDAAGGVVVVRFGDKQVRFVVG